jgi:hypothetical protein
MDLATVEVDPAEAKAKLAEYEGVLAKDRMVEDEAIGAAYRAAKRGLPIVMLSEVIARGGFFDDGPSVGWPRLAIVRADARECWVQTRSRWQQNEATFVYGDTADARNFGATVGSHTVAVTLDNERAAGGRRSYRASTVVPVIPPHVRPKRPRLSRFHVLWEVEAWSNVVPRDPALLRHIRGDLWTVQAMWDLTDLERLVLSQRQP